MAAATTQQNSGIAPASPSARGLCAKEQHHAEELQTTGQAGAGYGLFECFAKRPDQRRPGRRRRDLIVGRQHYSTTSARRGFGPAVMWTRLKVEA